MHGHISCTYTVAFDEIQDKEKATNEFLTSSKQPASGRRRGPVSVQHALCGPEPMKLPTGCCSGSHTKPQGCPSHHVGSAPSPRFYVVHRHGCCSVVHLPGVPAGGRAGRVASEGSPSRLACSITSTLHRQRTMISCERMELTRLKLATPRWVSERSTWCQDANRLCFP